MNWNNIRTIEKSQQNGFEEFVCQLAAQEKITNQKKFVRIGKPDAGKECYWELEDGTLYCWQAKYFTSTITASQWNQINESAKDVMDNHKTLKKYYISIPIDMPDGKRKGKTSLLSKWIQKVEEWKQYAKTKGNEIEIIYSAPSLPPRTFPGETLHKFLKSATSKTCRSHQLTMKYIQLFQAMLIVPF